MVVHGHRFSEHLPAQVGEHPPLSAVRHNVLHIASKGKGGIVKDGRCLFVEIYLGFDEVIQKPVGQLGIVEIGPVCFFRIRMTCTYFGCEYELFCHFLILIMCCLGRGSVLCDGIDALTVLQRYTIFL